MNDQSIMENLLLTTKGACDLYMHGAIESSTPNVHAVLSSALTDNLNMQQDVYQQMSQHGWYQMQQVDAQQIAQVKNKFAQMN